MADRVKVTLEAQFMPCTLLPIELERKGRELADLMAEKDRLEDAKKSAADHFKSKISETEAKCRGVYLVIRQGYEMREVQCRRVQDYDRRVVEIVREDTGEIVSSRPMNPTEVKEFEIAAQGRLFGEQERTKRLEDFPRSLESVGREAELEAQELEQKAVDLAEAMPAAPALSDTPHKRRGRKAAADTTGTATGQAAHPPDERAPGFIAPAENDTSCSICSCERFHGRPVAGVEGAVCRHCGHGKSFHQGRTVPVDPDPLRLAGFDPAAAKVDDREHETTAATYAKAAEGGSDAAS